MGKSINFGLAPPQDPMFGVSHANIVSKLNKRNWKSKATCRIHAEGPLYIMIQRGERSSKGRPKEIIYTVSGAIIDVTGVYRSSRRWRMLYPMPMARMGVTLARDLVPQKAHMSIPDQ